MQRLSTTTASLQVRSADGNVHSVGSTFSQSLIGSARRLRQVVGTAAASALWESLRLLSAPNKCQSTRLFSCYINPVKLARFQRDAACV